MAQNPIAHRHDRIFKSSLRAAEVADLLSIKLPLELVSQIELSTLAKCDPNLIAQDLSALQSDLVYRAKLKEGGDMYVILEQQVTDAKDMAQRIARYYAAVIGMHGQTPDSKLPFIVALCIYNGSATYKGPKNYQDLFQSPKLVAAFGSLYYLAIDLGRESDEELARLGRAALAMLLLKQGGVKKEFFEWLKEKKDLLAPLLNKATYTEEAISYIFAVEPKRTVEELQELLVAINPDKKQEIMSAAQRLINTSKIEGRHERELEIAQNMLKAGASVEFVKHVTQLQLAELQKLKPEA